MTPEILYGIGALVLLGVLVWATMQYPWRQNRTRDRATDCLFNKEGSTFDHNTQGTNEPWKRPGQASQDPSLSEPNPRPRRWADNETA